MAVFLFNTLTVCKVRHLLVSHVPLKVTSLSFKLDSFVLNSDRPVCLCLCPCLPHFSLVFRITDPWAGVIIINSVQR